MIGKAAIGLAILRIVVGVTYILHGWPKLMEGSRGTSEFLGQLGFPVPVAWAWLVTLLETVGGLLLILGLFVTPIALLFIIEMLVGIVLVHAPNGWYVIGPGQGGVELNVLLIAALLVLILTGPGAWALGRRQSAIHSTA